MSYLESNLRTVPTGFRKVLYFHWSLFLLISAVALFGFLMLYSVAGGNVETWAEPQIKRFAIGVALMFGIGFVHISVWRSLAGIAYIGSLLLLLSVEFFGDVGMGAQRWIDFGFLRLQPSELVKVTLILALAAYYDGINSSKVSRPAWVVMPVILIAVPMFIVLRQPDLGTAILLGAGGVALMFLAGVSWIYFAVAGLFVAAGVSLVLFSRGTGWQMLQNYQFQRIDTFLDPASDPLGAGYHITQSKIALGSGGWTGRGFMEGTQSRLNFLPEKHTDFIFTTLAEEFGFIGGVTLLSLYGLIVIFCVVSAMANKDRFSGLLVYGLSATFFFYFAVNMSMVMGIAPVVGVPLPLVSYGGSALMVIMIAFGLIQSAHIHRPR